MNRLMPIEQQDTLEMANVPKPSVPKPGISSFLNVQKLRDYVYLFLPLVALFLWFLSLQPIDVRQMNDLGMVSVFPPSFIAALFTMLVSFCLNLRQTNLHTRILFIHVIILIMMLYGTQNIVEQTNRFNTLYRHVGYTEYIMRTGSVDPQLDAYFNWPGFFILSAFITSISGYHDILSYAGWAPVFFNLIYGGPLYMIFCSVTANKRLVWLSLWFFYITNWVGQDYFSPQGLNFFLYLVIIAILLKWFKLPSLARSRMEGQFQMKSPRYSTIMKKFYVWLRSPDSFLTITKPRERIVLLFFLILIFAFVVFSHPLTPFFVLVSVGGLVIFRRCYPWWLPILMVIMTGLWIVFMTQTFLAGHSSMVVGSIGQVKSTVSANVTKRVVQGNLDHTIVAALRVFVAGLLWLLAFISIILRIRKGHRDITYILLALAPFPIVVAQPYGGEMFLRVYLFSLPFTVFFVASLFSSLRLSRPRPSWKMVIASFCFNFILLGCFLFTRYGNERMDYMTYAEVAGLHYLYNVAQPNSLFVGGWNDPPWQFQDFEKYQYSILSDVLPDAVPTRNVDAIVQFIKGQKRPHAYMIFTRSEKVTAESFAGLQPDALDRLEEALLNSGKFKLLYRNSDAQILMFTGSLT